MKYASIYLCLVFLVLVITFGFTYWISENVKDYEIISANEHVECIIVSRMLNTSVDCWEKFPDSESN